MTRITRSSRLAWHVPLALWLVGAVALAGDASVADKTADATTRTTSHAVWRARSQIVVDGEPTPLLWAVGISDPAQLDAYARVGFNAVEIVLSAPSDDTWRATAALAQGAADRGLLVLVTIAPPASQFEAIAMSPSDPSYQAAVRDYLQPILARAGQLPGVVAWVVEGAEIEDLHFDPTAFAHYLMRWYGSTQGVISAWGAPISDLSAITESFVGGVDEKKPLGLGRASVDLARYHSQAYRDLLDTWAQEIRRGDRSRRPESRRHLVLAGRQHSYRAAISVPESCDGMLLGIYPGVAEDDEQTHNIQGVDIARRGNQFAALPVLKVSAARSGAQLASWVAQALLHGAAGIGFANWADIRDDEHMRGALSAALSAAREMKLGARVPAACAAVLYEPFAAGGLAGGRGLYGWLTGVSLTEPGNLFRALARGTAFGQVDYLAESDLGSISLARYRVILAPLALSLNADAQAALARYVADGGTLVADLGLGFAQSGDLRQLPPTLAELFGVAPAPEGEKGSWPPPGGGPNPAAFAATMLPHARFPSLHQDLLERGGAELGSFDAPVYLVTLWGGAAPVLLQANQGSAFAGVMARQPYRPDAEPRDIWARGGGNRPDAEPRDSGARPFDRLRPPVPDSPGAVPSGVEGRARPGWAVYATTRLWQNWLPGDTTFDAFHRDLLGFDSPIARKRPPGLLPGDDVGAFQDGSIMLLKASAQPTELLVRNPGGRVYHIPGGVQEIRSAGVSANSLLTFDRPGLQAAEPLPIEISTDSQRVIVQVVSYGAEGISFIIYGPASEVVGARHALPLRVTAAGQATAHVRISPASGGQAGAVWPPAAGPYRVRRGGRHEIAVRQLYRADAEPRDSGARARNRDERSALRTITVGAEDVLAFDAPANTVVTIRPLPGKGSAPAAAGG